MKITKIVVGSFQVNCYLLEQEGSLVIIDPGANPKKLISIIEEMGDVKVLAILLTHAHFDHIGAVDALYQKYQCPIYLSYEDHILATNEEFNHMGLQSAKINSPLNDYPLNKLDIGPFSFQVLNTPGHSKGSICLYSEPYLFSGDTLFQYSIGRTDLYGGSMHQIMDSLKNLIQLPPETIVLPGHGDNTTIQAEILNNPFLQ